MSTDDRRVIVVGGGTAAAATVRGLRTGGYDGAIDLIGSEPVAPYERPPLSKTYLQKAMVAADLSVLPEHWYRDNDVRLHLGTTAVNIDPVARTVELSKGAMLGYGQLVLATGGSPRRLDLGQPDERVHYLRSIDDAERLRGELTTGRRIAIIGAGFIGGELAASARALGAEVTVVEMLSEPLALALGLDIGRVIREIHEDHGVRVLTSTRVTGTDSAGDQLVLQLDSGASIECDVLVIGVGLVPDTALAERAGIVCGNGIHVDEFCRTSIPAIHAAGDVAAHEHPLFRRRMRVEHHDNALKQGAAVAADILGRAEPFDDPHWFWSDQYDHQIQGVGVFDSSDEVVLRGSFAERRFTAFHLRAGRLVGAVGIDTGLDVRRAAKLIHSQAAVPAAALADRHADLRSLAHLTT